MYTDAFLNFINNTVHTEYRGYERGHRPGIRYSQGAAVTCLFIGRLNVQHLNIASGGKDAVRSHFSPSHWEAVVLAAHPIGSSILRYHFFTTTTDEYSGVNIASKALIHPDETLIIPNIIGQEAKISPAGQVEVYAGDRRVFIPDVGMINSRWLSPQ